MEPAGGVLRIRLFGKKVRVLNVVNTLSIYLLIIGIVAPVIHKGVSDE